MKNMAVVERTHEANIVRLVEEFGIRKEKRIREVYNKKREYMESNTTSTDFLAIIAYKKVRESLLK